ncbi:MAG: MBL fold metallo-hydrolase [Acidimicrobiales bacterium]
MLTLTVLGCDGSHASAGGAASGYLVREWDSGTTIWIDAGPGTFANLQRFCDPRSVNAIVLTHSHGDHWTDIDGFLTAGRWTANPPWGPVRVISAPGIAENLLQETAGVLEFEEIGESTPVTVGRLSLSFSRTDHPPVTYAVRVDGAGRTLGYSADTGPGWSFKELGSHFDLALYEATYTQEYEGTAGHMSGRQTGQLAREAGIRRLLITHCSPVISRDDVGAEARKTFGGPVEQASVGRGYTV